MSLEKIEAKIRDSGRKEIAEIRKKADDEIQAIMNDVEKEAESQTLRFRQKRVQEIDAAGKRIQADARMKASEIIEDIKSELVNEAFKTAADRILALSNTGKKKLLEKIASNGKKNLPKANIYIDPKYSSLFKANTREIGDFGLVFESPDGRVTVDSTLSELIERQSVVLKPRVGQILFENVSSG